MQNSWGHCIAKNGRLLFLDRRVCLECAHEQLLSINLVIYMVLLHRLRIPLSSCM